MPTTIRILAREANRRGDLFARLMADLFVALGYDAPRLNIAKSGREVDLEATHRLEKRRALGECKADAKATGGAELNKFAGVLSVEQSEDIPVTGYFISLAGYTSSALEQERSRRKFPIVTLDAAQIVEELIRGRVLVSRERASDIAGRLCAVVDDRVLDERIELLAHERGWVWAVYYSRGKGRSHFALIHADGTPLAASVALEIIAADRQCEALFRELACLNTPAAASEADKQRQTEAAIAAYLKLLANECGSIELDGLPADVDMGPRRLRLESLFVPLHLDISQHNFMRASIGSALSRYSHLAILGPPGSGKSTLIKRLATAYSDPKRRHQFGDDLPKRDWTPLVFRCRELRGAVRYSFSELVELVCRNEPLVQHTRALRAYVDEARAEGKLLFLIDGLDEISDPEDRATFVNTVRTAMLVHPHNSLVVTSREVGFRHVAAYLQPICTTAMLSPFNDEDIEQLSVAWHRQAIGDSDSVRADSKSFARLISQNDRIRMLATSPLLLTTLFLVRRWCGDLPTRRAILYEKAVKILLQTWNVMAFEPIREEEAFPQLSYIAFAMMKRGLTRISRPMLTAVLREARDALWAELAGVSSSVDEFIDRVNERAGLLVMSGIGVEDGRLEELFEFCHLAFQEFLTARAVCEGWHEGRAEHDTAASILERFLDDHRWHEVISLAATMGGHAADQLIRRLTACADRPHIRQILLQCLADKVVARADTIRAAIEALAR